MSAVQKAGWVIDRQRGSHPQMVHPNKPGQSFTVAGNLGDDMAVGTYRAIMKAAGLK